MALSEERLQKIREHADYAYRIHMEVSPDNRWDCIYPDVGHDYVCDVQDLLDEREEWESKSLADYHEREVLQEDNDRLRAFKKRATPILDEVARMGRDGWYYHPQQGWFCPFGCHIVMPEGAEKTRILLDRTETPAHHPDCGYVLARQWREEGKG